MPGTFFVAADRAARLEPPEPLSKNGVAEKARLVLRLRLPKEVLEVRRPVRKGLDDQLLGARWRRALRRPALQRLIEERQLRIAPPVRQLAPCACRPLPLFASDDFLR